MESIPAHAFVVFLAKFGHVPRLPALSRLGRTLVPGVQAHLTRYRGSARAGEGKREGCMAEHLVIFPGTGLDVLLAHQRSLLTLLFITQYISEAQCNPGTAAQQDALAPIDTPVSFCCKCLAFLE